MTQVCLIHAGAIGDFVMALRIVAAVRAHWPTANVEVLGHVSTASLAVGRGGVDHVTSLDHLPLHTLFSERGPVAPACKAYFSRFEIIINMYAAAAEPFTRRLREITTARVATIDPAPRDKDRHATDGWLEDLAAAVGGGRAARHGGQDGCLPFSPSARGLRVYNALLPGLSFSPAERREGRRRLIELAGRDDLPIILVHPGSGGRTKCWPIDNFARLVEALRRAPTAPIWVLGPVELEQHLMDGAVPADREGAQPEARHGHLAHALHGQDARATGAAPVLVEPDLIRASAAIAAADAYVGNDAGMTHVAAAAGTPTLALFGPTDPRVWRPVGEHVTVLRGEGSGTFGGLTVERACEAVLDMLRKVSLNPKNPRRRSGKSSR
jgi:heptosyltransferase-3